MRIARIEKAIADQKVFLHRVPDPDTRYRAEGNLMKLVEMSEAMRDAHGQLDGAS